MLAIAAATIVAPVSSGAQANVPQTLLQMADRYAAEFPVVAPPAGQTPDERIDWLRNERVAQGRTPQAWLDAVHAFTVDMPRATRASDVDIVSLVGALYSALDLNYDAAAVAEQVAQMPAELRAPFGDLLAVVARVYPMQTVIADAVNARLAAKPVDPHTILVTPVERDLMLANQQNIVDAINMFRARTANFFAVSPASTPIFQDPEGLVVLGSTGNDTYNRGGAILDPILLVDPDGADTYKNSAGGACPVTLATWMQCNSLVVSVVADLGAASNDTYTYTGLVAAVQGAGGPGGLGVLVDVGGNDTYYAKMTRTGPTFFSYFDGGAQGFGYGGAGLQLDGLGDDNYTFDVTNGTSGAAIWALGQGFGGAGGIGISTDLAGSDDWIGTATSASTAGQFIGVYTAGGGFYGGVGIVSDAGLGNDTWVGYTKAPSTDYYAQGFGAFGGVGILYEDGGNDKYSAFEQATSPNPQINPVLNCAFGTASFAGLGLMLELGGNDTYLGTTISTKSAYTMDFGFGGPGVAFGAFLDASGTDRYEMIAQKGTTSSVGLIEGYGYYNTGIGGDLLNWPIGRNSFGSFADLGGTDTYVGGGRAQNNAQWAAGVDRGV